MSTVLLLTSFDTREKEVMLLKGFIQEQGCDVITLDISTGPDPGSPECSLLPGSLPGGESRQ